MEAKAERGQRQRGGEARRRQRQRQGGRRRRGGGEAEAEARIVRRVGRGGASRRRASPSRAPALVAAPSACAVVEGRGAAAEMSGRESTGAWCRALVTGRARRRAEGREARRREGLREPGVVEWGEVLCRGLVQHEGEWMNGGGVSGRHRYWAGTTVGRERLRRGASSADAIVSDADARGWCQSMLRDGRR